MIQVQGSNIKIVEISSPKLIKNCDSILTNIKNIFLALQLMNKKILLEMNILNTNITISNICTKFSKKDYFSYRVNKNCGRFAGIISIV
jgi:copper oxidase (laccase) domain-containing protein